MKHSGNHKQSKLRSIGNSKGVILSGSLLQKAGISPNADIMITAQDGQITIVEIKPSDPVNTDLSTWEKQIRMAIKKGAKPDKDLFEGLSNDFDEKEWTW
ncbi:MAG TPA: hypothetical protein VLJ68_02170 [Chitinophagaceae bacterium]|nr:hypothetical protein [Chitinophagaceae bacterium]